MASRRFFGYDPYDYYYTASPYQYPYPYYYHHHQRAPARGAGGFFPAAGDADQYYYDQPAPTRSAAGFFPAAGDANQYYYKQPAPTRTASGFFPAARDPEAAAARPAARPNAGSSRSVSIPVHFVGSDTEPEIDRLPVKRAPSASEAVVRLQSAARGFLVRRALRALRAVEREAEEVACKVAREAEALRGDTKARIGVGELLLRLDAVRGAREYRRRVTRRVLELQDAVDALEQRPLAEAAAAEMVAEENAVAPELPGAGENSGVMDDKTAAEMEVDGGSGPASDVGAAEEANPAPCDDAHLARDIADDAGGEWEMVTEEPVAAAAAVSSSEEVARPQEPTAGQETRRPAAEAGGADGGVDVKKVMEMVAALCERSAQQCVLIGALAERVDALERAVRRVKDAKRRRRRAKKLRKVDRLHISVEEKAVYPAGKLRGMVSEPAMENIVHGDLDSVYYYP